MKKNYALLWLLPLFAYTFVYAQECPEFLGSSSALDLIHFKIESGTCTDYPFSITIEGRTFDKMSCNGTNLKYKLGSGSLLALKHTFSTKLGFGNCDYLDGVLRRETLFTEQTPNVINSLKVFPNPLVDNDEINIHFNKNVSARLNIYDLTGKMVISAELSNSTTKQINVSSLNNGIYLLQIVTDNSTSTRKIVIMK